MDRFNYVVKVVIDFVYEGIEVRIYRAYLHGSKSHKYKMTKARYKRMLNALKNQKRI